MCILNIFAVKYSFSDKIRIGKSSSKQIKGNFLSLHSILAYSRSFIPSDALRVKPNAN